MLNNRDLCEIQVSEERYECAISSIVATNYDNPEEGDFEPREGCNPQDGCMDFVRDDDYMQSAVADLTE